MNSTTLIIGVIAGSFGAGYVMFGRRNGMIIPIISGIVLGVFPYFVENIWILIGMSTFFIVLPWIVRW